MGITRYVAFLSSFLSLVVMALPAHGDYDASVAAGQTVTLSCGSASDSDCKIVDGDGTPETDYGFTYSWTAEWVGGGAAGTFPSGNEGRSVTWIAPATGGDVEITVTADSGSDKYADKGEDTWTVLVVKVDYVRLWDHHKICNRTTRAIDEDLRKVKEFEDNPRSDTDLSNNVPMLVVSCWHWYMDYADLRLECQFSPSNAAQYVLWKAEGPHLSWINGPTAGNFATSNPANIQLEVPKLGDYGEHSGKDVVVKVGVDRNMDGILQSGEYFGIEWGIRAIGEKEYYHCKDRGIWYLLNFDWIFLPDACELLEIFLDRDDIPLYSDTWPCVLLFDHHRYEQKNGLGTSETTNLTQESVTNYIWDSETRLRLNVFREQEFWDDVIQPCLEKMDILDWYNTYPGENSHTFSAVHQGNNVSFSESLNLSVSIGGYDFLVVCTVDTIRGTLYPEITRLETEGEIRDLYDFPTGTGDSYAGWVGRLITTYDPTYGRTGGQVFRLDVILDAGEDLQQPQEYDDYANIRFQWLVALGVL